MVTLWNFAHSDGNSWRTENRQTGTDGLRVLDLVLKILDRRGFQQFSAFPGGVADVQDDVGDGVEIELLHVGRAASFAIGCRRRRRFKGQIRSSWRLVSNRPLSDCAELVTID